MKGPVTISKDSANTSRELVSDVVSYFSCEWKKFARVSDKKKADLFLLHKCVYK